jgi:hypothetical protein
MNLLFLSVISFVMVFAMAFQSRNINSGQYLFAAGGSMFIGFSQAFVWRATTAGEGWTTVLVYSLSGGVGCVCAMWTHRRYVTKDIVAR